MVLRISFTSGICNHTSFSCLQEVACRKEEEERKAREKQEEEEAKCLEKFQDADPLEQDELHTFTDTMLPGCFHLLDELPDTVYRVCDLIMTAIKRNGADYRDMILKQVVNQVSSQARHQKLEVFKVIFPSFIKTTFLKSLAFYLICLYSVCYFGCSLVLLGCLNYLIYPFCKKIVLRKHKAIHQTS